MAARTLVERAVADANRGRARHEQIRRFAIPSRGLSAEPSELAPTLGVRRSVREEHFRDQIERPYVGA